MKKLIFSFLWLFMLVACQSLNGQSLEDLAVGWKATNPGGGGAFNSPVITSEGYWAVGSDLGGVYLSKNSGASWVAIGGRNGLNATHIASMNTVPGKLLIGTDGGIYTATSSGSSARRTFTDGYVAAMVVSADPAIVYAAIHPQWNALKPYIIRSNDAGETWTLTGSNLPANVRITGMRAHPVDPDGVWVISGEGRFNSGPKQAFFSTNGGQSFTRLDPQQGSLIDIAYAQDPSNLNLMYATTVLSNGTGQVFKSLDTGFNWTNITPTTQKPSGVILADVTNANHVRIIDLDQRNGKASYMWESSDAGSSWSRYILGVNGGWSGADELWGMGYSFQGIAQTIGYNPMTPNTVLWANSQFVYKSSDGGKSWVDVVSKGVGTNWRSRGIDNVVPMVVEPSKADPNLVYAGYMDMGLWRSDDGGGSWKSLNLPQYSGGWSTAVGGNTLSVVADPNRPDVVWAQVGGNLESDPMFLLKSTNRGDSWGLSGAGLPSPLNRLEGLSVVPTSPSTSRRLYVVANGDVYSSPNDGASWQLSFDCVNNDCIKMIYTSGGVVALSPSGIWRLQSGSWRALSLPASMTLGWSPGLHWLFDPWDYVGPMDVASRGSELWIAVKGTGKGIYYSANNGRDWSKVLSDNHARAVEVDPVTAEVYVGSSSALSQGGFRSDSKGLMVSANGINNWTQRNQGLAYKFATSISISPNGTGWITSSGQGVMKWH
jgi:photosystem II stability/assembly factor-like uncharacterized protein